MAEDLRGLLSKMSKDESDVVKSAVEKTHNFVRLTSLMLQTKSDGAITPSDIKVLLEDTAKGLQALRDVGSDERQGKRAKEILETCCQTLKAQLDSLYDLNNSIGKYYRDNPTALKEQVEGKGNRPRSGGG